MLLAHPSRSSTLQADRGKIRSKFESIGLDRSSFIRWDDFLRLADYLLVAEQDTVTATYTEVLEKDLRKKKKKKKKAAKSKARAPLKDLGPGAGALALHCKDLSPHDIALPAGVPKTKAANGTGKTGPRCVLGRPVARLSLMRRVSAV